MMHLVLSSMGAMASRNQHDGQIRLFRNERLESLTRISLPGFLVVWAIALPLIAWTALGTADLAGAIALVALGIGVWSLFEYAMHRFLFHWESRNAFVRGCVFVMHGNHHDLPNDATRNLMPPIASFPIAGVVWAVCHLVAGAGANWTFFGFMLGYFAYDLVHYACHQWPMRGRFAQMMKRHHMRHHHVAVGGNYAITALFWDRVLGTRITSLKSRG